jgi:5-formyltetrahydrofolate cyclo-ligase
MMDGPKNKIRAEMASRKHALSPSDKSAWDAAIFRKLIANGVLAGSHTVCCYRSFGKEVDTANIINELRQNGKKIVFPEDLSSAVDAFIIPGLAFDGSGNRLGRGGGFYDRMLANYNGYKIAIGYDFQIVGEVPRQDHDVIMDLIITEKRIIVPK